MSDKYKEMAERFLACCKTFFYPGPLVSDVALIADAMRYCAAKLEEEREKESRKDHAALRKLRALEAAGVDCWEGYEAAMSNMNESVIAPTSAGGTTKSIAVTPDE